MANNVIVYTSGGTHLMRPGTSVISDESGFDTVTQRLFFGSGLTFDYNRGAIKECPVPVGSGGQMVYIGPTDIDTYPGIASNTAPQVATCTWRGLLSGNSQGKRETETRTIRESLYSSLAGVPGAGGSVRCRLLDQVVGFSVREVRASASKPTPPTIQAIGTAPTGAPTNVSQVPVWGAAETWCYPRGWICYNWQMEEPIPGIYFLTADYKYEHQKQFS